MDTKHWISSSLASLFTRDCRVSLVSLIRRLIQGLRSTVVSAAGALLCFALFGVTHPAYGTPINGEWGAYVNGYIHNDAVCGFLNGSPACLQNPYPLDPRLHPLSDGYFVGWPLGTTYATGFSGCEPLNGCDSYSAATADLATGDITLEADARCCAPNNGNPLPVQAIAGMFDTLVFSGAQPGAQGTVHMSGVYSGSGTTEAGVALEFQLGQFNPETYGYAYSMHTGLLNQPDVSGPWSRSVTFNIQNGVPYELWAALVLFASHAPICPCAGPNGDALMSDPISFDLPAGVTFESASGVFLTGATVPAPEPATLVILGLGLAVLGFSRRKRE